MKYSAEYLLCKPSENELFFLFEKKSSKNFTEENKSFLEHIRDHEYLITADFNEKNRYVLYTHKNLIFFFSTSVNICC